MQSKHGKSFISSAQIHPQTSKPTERARAPKGGDDEDVGASVLFSGNDTLIWALVFDGRWDTQTGKGSCREEPLFLIQTFSLNYKERLFFVQPRLRKYLSALQFSRSEILHNDIVHSLSRYLTILYQSIALAIDSMELRRKLILQLAPFSFPRIHRRHPLQLCDSHSPTALHYSRTRRERKSNSGSSGVVNSRCEKVKSHLHGFAIFFARPTCEKSQSQLKVCGTQRKSVLCATRDLNSESTLSPQGSTLCTAFCSGWVLGIRYDIFIKASGEKITHSAPKAEEIAFY